MPLPLFDQLNLTATVVEGSPYTHAYVMDRLQRTHKELRDLFSAGAKIKAIACSLLSEGVTSSIYKYTIQLNHPLLNVEIGVALKIVTCARMETISRQLSSFENPLFTREMASLHDNECAFYELFGYEDAPGYDPLIPLPRIYHIERLDEQMNGLIIMEDLSANTGKVDITDGLTREKVMAVVRNLAKFHGHILAEKQRGTWATDPLINEIFWQKEVVAGSASVKGMLQRVIKANPVMGRAVQRLQRTVGADYVRWAYHDFALEHHIPLVVVHGDLWSHNLLWWTPRDNNETQCKRDIALTDEPVFIDWQAAFVGCAMMDLARLLMSCETSVRRSIEHEAIMLYCAILETEAVGKNCQMNFSREAMYNAYELNLANQATNFVLIFGGLYDLNSTTSTHVEDINIRLMEALKDAIAILKRLAPEWLDD